MHPVHLEALAAERRKDLHTAASRQRLVHEARTNTHLRPRRLDQMLGAYAAALSAFVRRYRREMRIRAGHAHVRMWRGHEPTRGF